jgi:ribonuclease R
MAKPPLNLDPYATREASNYDSPVPSREFVLDFLRESVGPVTYGERWSGGPQSPWWLWDS